MHIHELLMYTVRNNASDLHLTAGDVPMVRIHGEIQRLNMPPITPDEAKKLIYSVMNERQKSRFEENLELDFAIGVMGLGRFRVNVYNQVRGIAAAFRYIPARIRSLKELGMPKVIEKFAKYPRGLVLITGPTGSGKSTTLAAIIDIINENRACHIITIEDPVEYVHKPKKCMINQREVGPHTKSFSNALRSALREDPDIILVGEMRDLETISLALTAAETGHLVFATLHTNNAVETIDRIIDVFPSQQQEQVRTQLAETLKAVVSQTLIRTKDGTGRVCACEILISNYAVRNMIRENKTFQIPSIIQTSSQLGMVLMESSLRELAIKGMITREVAIEISGNQQLFDKKD